MSTAFFFFPSFLAEKKENAGGLGGVGAGGGGGAGFGFGFGFAVSSESSGRNENAPKSGIGESLSSLCAAAMNDER